MIPLSPEYLHPPLPYLRGYSWYNTAVRNQVLLRNAIGKRYDCLSGYVFVIGVFMSFWFRAVQTESLPPSASEGILNKQRLNRPSSPHFTIYQPQLTWIASIANRATGGALSARTCPLFSLKVTSGLMFAVYSLIRFLDCLPIRTWHF